MIAVSFDTRKTPIGYIKMCRSLRSLLFPAAAADENGYRFYLPLASLACVEMVIIFILCDESECEARAGLTSDTDETASPSVALLMLQNVKHS